MSCAVVTVHGSGKVTATPDQWRELLDEYALGANVLTLTETGGQGELLERWAEVRGWWLYWSDAEPGQGEIAVLVRKSYGEGVRVRWRRLSPLRLRTSRKAPIWALKVLVEHVHGGRVWVTVAHLPAHVEGRRGLLAGWASEVYRSCLLGWAGMRFGHQAGGHIIAADWNLNHRLRWVRVMLGLAFPGTRTGWDARALPMDGTFGGRLIDGHRSTLRVLMHSAVLRPIYGFDHRGVMTIWSLR